MSGACSRALDLLPADEAGARAHAAACPSCAEIVEAWRAAEGAERPVLDEKVSERVRATVLHELKLTPEPGSWRAAALAFGGIAVFVTVLMALVIPASKNLKVESPGAAFAFTAALLAMQLFAGWWAVRPRAGRRHLAALLACAAVVLLGLAAPGLSSAGPVEGAKQLSCLKVQLGLAVIPLVIGLLALRHNAPSMLRGALVGAAAGTAGAVPLYWHCSNLEVSHLAPFHLGGWALAVIASAIVAKLLTPRAWAP